MEMSPTPTIRRRAVRSGLILILFAGLALATAGGAAAIAISDIQFNPGSHAALSWDMTVTVTWDHSLGFFEDDGVRIFVRPMTAGALSPHYAASGGTLYMPGSTGGSSTFKTFTSSSAPTVGSPRRSMSRPGPPGTRRARGPGISGLAFLNRLSSTGFASTWRTP